MKKNDMWTMILGHLRQYALCIHKYPTLAEDHAKRIAQNIMIKQEQLGMLPPANEDRYHNMDNEDRVTLNLAKYIHLWEEPEESE